MISMHHSEKKPNMSWNEWMNKWNPWFCYYGWLALLWFFNTTMDNTRSIDLGMHRYGSRYLLNNPLNISQGLCTWHHMHALILSFSFMPFVLDCHCWWLPRIVDKPSLFCSNDHYIIFIYPAVPDWVVYLFFKSKKCIMIGKWVKNLLKETVTQSINLVIIGSGGLELCWTWHLAMVHSSSLSCSMPKPFCYYWTKDNPLWLLIPPSCVPPHADDLSSPAVPAVAVMARHDINHDEWGGVSTHTGSSPQMERKYIMA